MSKPLLMLDEPSMGLRPISGRSRSSMTSSASCTPRVRPSCLWSRTRRRRFVADRAYVLETGKISLTGTGAELMASDAVRKAYPAAEGKANHLTRQRGPCLS